MNLSRPECDDFVQRGLAPFQPPVWKAANDDGVDENQSDGMK